MHLQTRRLKLTKLDGVISASEHHRKKLGGRGVQSISGERCHFPNGRPLGDRSQSVTLPGSLTLEPFDTLPISPRNRQQEYPFEPPLNASFPGAFTRLTETS
jgi:hypothetical protein